MNEDLIKIHLSCAVPLEIARLRTSPRQVYTVLNNREVYVEALGHYGDVLMFGGGPKGQAGQVMAALTQALAALAFAPGGVKFSGLHFEASF